MRSPRICQDETAASIDGRVTKKDPRFYFLRSVQQLFWHSAIAVSSTEKYTSTRMQGQEEGPHPEQAACKADQQEHQRGPHAKADLHAQLAAVTSATLAG